MRTRKYIVKHAYSYLYLYIYISIYLILYDHIYRGQGIKHIFWDQTYSQDQENDVYMILYINSNNICNVMYIYNIL